MNRQEHLAWCKKRTLQYVDQGEIGQAWASMTSDLRKHSETADHSAILIGSQLLMSGELLTAEKMRNFIKGFN